jgi:hypothetical protein
MTNSPIAQKGHSMRLRKLAQVGVKTSSTLDSAAQSRIAAVLWVKRLSATR